MLGMALGKMAAGAGWHVALVDQCKTLRRNLPAKPGEITAFTGADLLDEPATQALFTESGSSWAGSMRWLMRRGVYWTTAERADASVWRGMHDMNS